MTRMTSSLGSSRIQQADDAVQVEYCYSCGDSSRDRMMVCDAEDDDEEDKYNDGVEDSEAKSKQEVAENSGC